jgi:hypothetical protein
LGGSALGSTGATYNGSASASLASLSATGTAGFMETPILDVDVTLTHDLDVDATIEHDLNVSITMKDDDDDS